MTEADLYQKQQEIEHSYAAESVLASIESTRKAIKEGRLPDITAGKRLLSNAFDITREGVCRPTGKGRPNKHWGLIERVDPDIATVITLRYRLSVAASVERGYMQSVCLNIGRLIETEAMISKISELNPVYLKRTVQYLDDARTQSFHHRRRTFQAAADNLQLNWESWSSEESIQVGQILCTAAFETGLFVWLPDDKFTRGKTPKYVLSATPALAAHLEEVTQEAKNIVKFPPMIVKPMPRLGMHEGGYLTPYFQVRAPMITFRAKSKRQRWAIQQLDSPRANELKNAMTKAQNVGYRVNKAVLSVLGQALARGKGAFGTVPTAPLEKPQCPCEGVPKDNRTPEQITQFNVWKEGMVAYYANEVTRKGRNSGLVGKVAELRRYADYSALYFPAFVDWRGRVYFRSTISPQNSDAVKGCLDFAVGKRLGERGLFWLKVHIATCAGYDKHTPELRAKWTDDQLDQLFDYYENPLDVEPPEQDTAVTLYQALHALREAMELENPADYICHVPVAVDATCSGLQHFSAMLRDPVGASFTNLSDDGADKKSDIYAHVSGLADAVKHECTDDVVMQDYWKDKPITRNMAKRPVMTYVYSATATSCNDYIADAVRSTYEQLVDDDGKIIYSTNKLCFVITKAIRGSIEKAVPAATNGMAYLQTLVKLNRDKPLSYISPVGMPVLFWAPKSIAKEIFIRSMGMNKIRIKCDTEEHNCSKAVAGVSPNFIHSLDSAHLCKVLNATDISLVCIHDSFATHPCDVDELNTVLRREFFKMYDEVDVLGDFVAQQEQAGRAVVEPPKRGSFDLSNVLTSRFMFC
jgi:DNA-directed RNA polymerase